MIRIIPKIGLTLKTAVYKIKESAENYLETILILSKKLPVVRSVDIANELGFKKSSSPAAWAEKVTVTITIKISNADTKRFFIHSFLLPKIIGCSFSLRLYYGRTCAFQTAF